MNLFKKASQLRKKNPRLTVPASVKLAAKENRKKGLSGVKKKRATVKKVIRRPKVSTAKKVVRKKAAKTVAAAVSFARKNILESIGKMEAQKFAARLIRDKKKIAKKIAEKKKLFKKLS